MFRQISSSPHWLGLAIAVSIAIPGCGKGRPECVRVSGKVLLDGKPVTGGLIRVVPTQNRRAEGVIGEDGRFTLSTFDKGDGCVKGTHPVEVLGTEKLPDGQLRNSTPLKYQQSSTSDLTVNITGPTDDLVIELKSEGEPLVPTNAGSIQGDSNPNSLRWSGSKAGP